METYLNSKSETWLPWFTRGLIVVVFVLLVGRLFELQIIKGAFYKELSESNRIRRVNISAPRGKILARGGEVLVSNKEIKKRVIFDPSEGYEKVEDISGALEIELITEWERYYPLAEKFAHVSGYVGIVDPEELGKIDPKCMEKGPKKLTSVVGRTGLEEYYNCLLTGVDGELLLEVDTSGKIIRILGRKDPIPGIDLKTNIDYGLQNKLADSIKNKEGVDPLLIEDPQSLDAAGIVTDAEGQVMALYSYPSYDPNLFVKRHTDIEILDILNDDRMPMFNRVIGGTFHPGSVFKPLVALAAREEAIDKDYKFTDNGVIEIKTIYGNYSYSNWYFTQYGGVEGEIDLPKAIARSTDTFFYKIGELAGVDKLDDWGTKMGLDKKTEIDLVGEVAGLVPSPKWKEETKNEKWFLGNTYHFSIGQGDLAVSPVGENRMITAIANSGKLCDPRIFGKGECLDLKISTEDISDVKKGMVMACSEGGTAFSFFPVNKGADDKNNVACKTGTAETTDGKNPHAWFVMFVPSQNPEMVATILVENGGEGSRVAGPIAKSIYDYWTQYHKNDR